MSAGVGIVGACRGTDLDETTLNGLLDLTQSNMAVMYDACPGWGWDRAGKAEEFKDPDSQYLILSESTGFAMYRVDTPEDEVYLWELQLCNTGCGRGFGSLLLNEVEQIARRAGVAQVTLTVFKSNLRAVAFFYSKGYSIDDTDPSLYEDEEEVGYLILSKSMH